jgi:hypothetical protein
MDIATFLASLESSGLASRIRDSLYIFPMLEATHVLGLAMVVGTITIIDLRLLGLASTRRSFKRMASDTLKWTWAAFLVTGVTGALMFITNANVYYHNFFFRTKMLMLVLAGLNVLVFELTAGRTMNRWDKAPSSPPIGRLTAVFSLLIWISVIFLGRWIGFTTTRTTVGPEPEINFDNLFPGASGGPAAPSK